jgi:hypothetical protein
MPRNALALGGALAFGLLTACQSAGPSSPPPDPAPAAAPAEADGGNAEVAAEPPETERAGEAAEAAAPVAGALAGHPSVVLEDGRDLMSLEGLPARDQVPVADVPAGDLTTRDGIYTLEQATRGAELVKSTCAECHDPEDWRERGFLGRWVGESTYQLWYYINDRMPYRNPWTLTRQEVTDALAYILYVNELPAGDEEMGTTDDDIDDFWIVWDAATH